MKIARDDLHVLAGSYVLDAVDDAEREEFERHLPYCAACQAEVRGLRETAARLALARAVTPPARMEQRVLAAARRTRQLPPLPAHRPGRLAARLTRLPRHVAVAAAAAAVAAAVALGVTQLAAQHQLQSRVPCAKTHPPHQLHSPLTPHRLRAPNSLDGASLLFQRQRWSIDVAWSGCFGGPAVTFPERCGRTVRS